MLNERRNYGRRAEMMRTIVDCLTRHHRGITIGYLVEVHHTLPRSGCRADREAFGDSGVGSPAVCRKMDSDPATSPPGRLVVGVGV